MSTAVLRASGTNFDVDAFLRRSSGIRPDNVWHRGDAALHGRVRNESGFAAPVAEADDGEEVVMRVFSFLGGCSKLITDLAASGAASVIDVSLEVGSGVHYASSIRFGPDVLRRLAELSVGLEISGYPVSDE
ncbi:MAG: hypothetical protein WA208_15035 [Thermoanaerobaculia bacterium]